MTGSIVPQVAYTTGDLDVHDMAVDAQGGPVFVNTLFGCLATLSETHSFLPLWKPPFISAAGRRGPLPPERPGDGDGRPAYVTAVSAIDVADGWRDQPRRRRHRDRRAETDEIVARGLSMPHSPRCTRAGCGCSIQAPAISATSTCERAGSSRWRSARATCAGCPSSAISPSWACRKPRDNRPSRACRWTKPGSARGRAALRRSGDRPAHRRRRALAAHRGRRAASSTTSSSCPA